MDNIGKRILHVLAEKKAKPTPFEVKKDISRGYLKRSADSGTGIGTEIVEKILLEYPDVDAYWLITGQKLPSDKEESDKKHTAATKSIEAAVKQEILDDLKTFRDLALSQQRTIELLSSKIS